MTKRTRGPNYIKAYDVQITLPIRKEMKTWLEKEKERTNARSINAVVRKIIFIAMCEREGLLNDEF